MSRKKSQRIQKDSEFSGPDGETLRLLYSSFLTHLKAKRESLGLQQQEIAKLGGLAPGHYSNIERGERGMTIPTFIRIAKGFGERPSELAVYLGSLPKSETTVRGPIVAVATDGTPSREVIRDALGELAAGSARLDEIERKLERLQAKVASPKKARSR